MGGLDYKPSARVMATKPKRPLKDRGFTYRPKVPKAKSTSRKPERTYTRKQLVRACLEEFYLGGSGIAALYSSLLCRTLADLEPDLRDFGKAVEGILQEE